MHDPMGPTYHRLSNFAINVDGDRATARTYVHAVLMATPDDTGQLGRRPRPLRRRTRPDADGWRIAHSAPPTSPRMQTGGGAASMTDDFAQKYGPWAVIAGASEGIGASLADQLAERGLDLVLIARNGTLLNEVAAGVRERHGVEVRPWCRI